MKPRTVLVCVCLVWISLLAVSCSRSATGYIQAGQKYFDAGKYDDAIINYRKALQKDPKSGEAYYRLALADLKKSNIPEAYQALNGASKYSPDNGEIQSVFADLCFELYLVDPRHPKVLYENAAKVSAALLQKDKRSYDGLRLKGYLAMVDRKPADAVESLRKADQVRPMQRAVVYPLAQALIQDQRPREAETLVQAFLQKDKTFGPIYDILFALYTNGGREQEAENILKAKVDNNSKQGMYVLNLANYYRVKQRPEDMRKALQRLEDRNYPLGRMLLGDFYLAQRNFAEAMNQYNQGLASDSKNKVVYQKKIVNALIAQGKRPEATALAEELVKAHPDDDEAQLVRATLWLESGKREAVDSAIQALKPLAVKKPDSANLRYRLGQAYQAKGMLRDAEAEMQAAAKADPAFMPARIALAELNLQGGHADKALDYCNQMLQNEPDNQGVHFLHAIALSGLSKTEEARTELNGVLKAAPNSVIARLAVGRLDLLEKRFPAAEKQFRDLYTPGQSDLRPLDGLLATYLAGKQLDKALALLEKELQAAPDNPNLIVRTAEVEVRAGKYAEGRDQYRRLLAKDPNSASLHLRIAEISAAMGDSNGALSESKRATEIDPKYARAWLEFASFELQTGKKQEALGSFQKALALSPDNPAILNNVAYLMADQGGDMKEAMRLAQKGLEKAPKDPHLSDTVGFIYWKQNLNGSAIQTFRTVVQNWPENPTYRLHLANALLSGGDKAGARTQLEAALMRNPAKDEESQIRSLLTQLNR